MNKEIIEKMTFREKKFFVLETCLMYRKLKKISRNTKLFDDKKKANYFVKKYRRQSKKNISVFETILNLLKPEEKLVINKEYIEEPYTQYWYEEKWSKTTYYKIKHQAVNNFLFLLYA